MGRIQQSRTKPLLSPSADQNYDAFDELDGTHSWQQAVTEGYVLYRARKVVPGQVTYFNFALAKEMGLIPKDHPQIMNKKLELKILDTFSIRIINEYDQKQNIRYHPTVLKDNPYMATRYLQLQHKDKTGRTSGDGRSVWNGEIARNGTVWDVSSRGTGVTCLAPGAVEADKPLRSGSTGFGYGCGMADIDELLGAAIMAEIFHNSGVRTERVLTVIDSGRGLGIGVRAGQNLFRPAHLFLFLKQGQLEALKKATDYLIERQHRNHEWSFGVNHKRKYDMMLKEIAESFAQFAAHLDRDYIFAWLDWDGDNVLANAGIIDYGSIRQFGLRHDEYRYDDVDRYSTNMREQRLKARQTVQTFVQLVDFLNTGRKRQRKEFAQHRSLKQFDESFDYYVLDRFLYQVGLSRTKRELLLEKNFALVKSCFNDYHALERIKTKRKTQKVADGINRPAIFNMRHILALLPEQLYVSLLSGSLELLPEQEFFTYILAESARGPDRKPNTYVFGKIKSFQVKYAELLSHAAGGTGMKNLLLKMCKQAHELNSHKRLTGDGLLYVVDEILKFKKKNGDNHSIQAVMDQFIVDQSPKIQQEFEPSTFRTHRNRHVKALLTTILTLVDDTKESI